MEALTEEKAQEKTETRKHSSLYGKSLPRFEVARGYEEYANSDHRMKPRKQEAAAVKQDPKPLSFEEQVDKCLCSVGNQQCLRELLLRLLGYCAEQRTRAQAEDFVANCDEYVYSHVIQSPTTIVSIMVKNCGLEQTDVDAEGKPVTDELRADLTADELDDLIIDTLFETTAAGKAVLDMLQPAKRFEAQLNKNRGRIDTFYAILDYCAQEPRKFPQIKEFYTQHDEFEKSTALDSQQLACDFYVDKLEAAGMLVWKGQWEVTQAGKEALAAREA